MKCLQILSQQSSPSEREEKPREENICRIKCLLSRASWTQGGGTLCEAISINWHLCQTRSCRVSHSVLGPVQSTVVELSQLNYAPLWLFLSIFSQQAVLVVVEISEWWKSNQPARLNRDDVEVYWDDEKINNCRGGNKWPRALSIICSSQRTNRTNPRNLPKKTSENGTAASRGFWTSSKEWLNLSKPSRSRAEGENIHPITIKWRFITGKMYYCQG